MAIYHCNVKIIGRSNGRSATGAAAYRSGEKIHDERSGLTHDYTRKNNIDYTEILAPTNSPAWVHDRSTLWNTVETIEKRKDSQLCREVEVALPVELSPAQSRELVRGFIQNEFVKKGMVADLAIHHAKGENPHAHILLTTRHITPEGFTTKNRDWNHKDLMKSWRVSWQEHTNKALEHAGHKVRVDHRTLDAQGIERVPQIHVGAKVREMELRGIRTERGALALEIENTNEKITELQNNREATAHEHDIKNQTRQDNGRDGERDRTTSPSTGNTGGSSHGTPVPTAEQERRAHGAVDTGTDGNIDSMGRSLSGFERSGAHAHQRNEPRPEGDQRAGMAVDTPEPDNVDPAYSGAAQRILDLAGPTDRGKGRHDRNRVSHQRLDRTYLAVRRQLKAMQCEAFEVGIRNREGKMMIRSWSSGEVLHSVDWLKRENAKGADIYIRPAGQKNQGLILVDDLTQGSISRMKSEGLEPAAVVETSPQNYQAWVRVSQTPITPEIATGISKSIADHFDADPNSADWRHFGRLAGFTNRKPEHTTAQGRNPWVLCHDSSGQQASHGEVFVKRVKTQVETLQAQNEKENRLRSATEAPDRPKRYDPVRTYQLNLKSLTKRYGADLDLSRADFMICSTMAKQGFTSKQLLETLKTASPELPTRKAGHELDYCQRTVTAVFESSQVQDHLKTQSRQKSRGFSL